MGEVTISKMHFVSAKDEKDITKVKKIRFETDEKGIISCKTEKIVEKEILVEGFATKDFDKVPMTINEVLQEVPSMSKIQAIIKEGGKVRVNVPYQSFENDEGKIITFLRMKTLKKLKVLGDATPDPLMQGDFGL